MESLNEETGAMKAFILAKENDLRQHEEKIRELQTKVEKAAELNKQLILISKEIAPFDIEKKVLSQS